MGSFLDFPLKKPARKTHPRLGFLKRCLEPSVRKRITAEVCVWLGEAGGLNTWVDVGGWWRGDTKQVATTMVSATETNKERNEETCEQARTN